MSVLHGEEVGKRALACLNFALQHYRKDTVAADKVLDAAMSESWKSLMQQLSARPQSQIDGTVWILKPGRKSRGRGISLHASLASLRVAMHPGHSYVVQKYVEQPLLIHKRKFDIRLWALVCSVQPLEVWLYEKCYIRFSVLEYDLSNLSNKFVHLTNNSVSKDAAEFADSEIQGCMWSLRRFRRHMEKRFHSGVWTEQVFPRIERIVVQTVSAAERSIEPRKGAFELLGFDILIAADLTPWLLEVNSSPSLQHSTNVTERLIPALLEDLVKVVVDRQQEAGRAGHFHRLVPV